MRRFLIFILLAQFVFSGLSLLPAPELHRQFIARRFSLRKFLLLGQRGNPWRATFFIPAFALFQHVVPLVGPVPPAGSSSASFSHKYSGVNGTSCTSSTCASITASLSGSPSQTDTIIAALIAGNGTGASSLPSGLTIKDANSNSFSASGSSPVDLEESGEYYDLWIYYLINAPSNVSGTITATWTNNNYAGMWLEDFSLSSGSAAYDKDAPESNQTASGTTISSPSITPAEATELLYACVVPLNGNITAPAAGNTLGGWTGAGGGIVTGVGDCEYIVSSGSSATSVDFTDSYSNDYFASLAAGIKP